MGEVWSVGWMAGGRVCWVLLLAQRRVRGGIQQRLPYLPPRAERGALGARPPAHADSGGGQHRCGVRAPSVPTPQPLLLPVHALRRRRCSADAQLPPSLVCALDLQPDPAPAAAVCTTLSFSGSGAFTRLTRKFDVVVVDEAAQVRAGVRARVRAGGRATALASCCSQPLEAPVPVLPQPAKLPPTPPRPTSPPNRRP